MDAEGTYCAVPTASLSLPKQQAWKPIVDFCLAFFASNQCMTFVFYPIKSFGDKNICEYLAWSSYVVIRSEGGYNYYFGLYLALAPSSNTVWIFSTVNLNINNGLAAYHKWFTEICKFSWFHASGLHYQELKTACLRSKNFLLA